jgi:hypothetical protein
LTGIFHLTRERATEATCHFRFLTFVKVFQPVQRLAAPYRFDFGAKCAIVTEIKKNTPINRPARNRSTFGAFFEEPLGEA